jgi:endonuclease YncB( thermonuclease family)
MVNAEFNLELENMILLYHMGCLHKKEVINYNTIPIFDKRGMVLKILDGDTIDVLVNHYSFPCSLQPILYRIRIKHLDAPETKLGENVNQQEKQRGLDAKTFITKWLSGRRVRVVASGTDAFGRVLADVWHNGVLVSAEMKRLGHIKHNSKWNE